MNKKEGEFSTLEEAGTETEVTRLKSHQGLMINWILFHHKLGGGRGMGPSLSR